MMNKKCHYNILLKLFISYILFQTLSEFAVCSSDDDDDQMDVFSCCRNLTDPCKTSCESLSLLKLTTMTSTKEIYLHNLKKFCPETNLIFWNCMNKALELIDNGSQWFGRSCCSNAVLTKCQQGCIISQSTTALNTYCRQSDEYSLFSCIEQLERKTECCSNAKSYDCLQTCQQMFNKTTSMIDLENLLYENCNANNVDVIDCVHDNVDVKIFSNEGNHMECCRYASSKLCKDTCEKSLKNSNYTEIELLDLLEEKCGGVNLSSEFWKCFLNEKSRKKDIENIDDVSRIKNIGIDSAKLHCCEKAHSSNCWRNCFNIFSYSDNYSSSPEAFQKECLQNTNERDLKQCIDEIDFPVEIGCDGLSFCTNFNNRPTELFRNCNPIADNAARNEYNLWKDQNTLKIFDFNFPVIYMNNCLPILHTISCILELKPTTRSLHLNQICWDDCYDALSRCMDWKRMENRDVIPANICSLLSPDRSAPCVSVKNYMEPSDSPLTNEVKIMSPCRGHKCNITSEICEINRNSNKPTCLTGGCSVGETSNYIVPSNSYFRIPSSSKRGCYKICKCMNGKIEKCQLLPCVAPRPCRLGNLTIEHGSSIAIECNTCICFAEEITCTKKQCKIYGITDKTFTTLPCNCPPHYVPVCARNGRTYPSACLAKCVGFPDTDFEFGTCESKNPCKNHECPRETTCFPSRNICLSNQKHSCPQYRCVSHDTNNCELEPLTDTTMSIHSSFCSLIKAKRNLAYVGVFDEHICNTGGGVVCGINGVTYSSECEALSDFSMVDYYGNCKAVGLIDSETNCMNVKCPKSLPENCLGIIPTGACCPICGGALKIVYSRKQIDRGIYALNNTHHELLTLKSLLRSLQRLIKVSSCFLSGFLTFETDIMIIIYPINKNPSIIEIDVCRQEAMKITNLIITKSHHFSSNLGLSSFISASYVKATISMASISMKSINLIMFTSLISIYTSHLVP